MKERLKRLCCLIGLFVLIVVIAVIALPVQSHAKTRGLTVSPLRTEFAISPGTSLDGVLTVTNSTDKSMPIHANAAEFGVINQQYDYVFSEESESAKWVAFTPKRALLTAGETKKILFRVSVPLSAEPGGQYLSLFVATDNETDDGGISSRQRIASLLYITINGDVSRTGHVVSLISPWVVSGEGTWSVALQNSGTAHFRSRYSVRVQDLLGRDTGVGTTGNALILPGTVRAVADDLLTPQLPGLYKYVYTIGLGDTPAAIRTRLVLSISPTIIQVSLIILILTIAELLRRRSHQH